jgi:hypothetical protein
MSDALTDIERDKEITRWCENNIDPILIEWAQGRASDDETANKILTLLEREDIPKHRGYFSDPATDIVKRMVTRVSNQAGFKDAVKAYLMSTGKLEEGETGEREVESGSAQ